MGVLKRLIDAERPEYQSGMLLQTPRPSKDGCSAPMTMNPRLLAATCRVLVCAVLVLGSTALAAKPSISSFTASDHSVSTGVDVTLSWEVLGATQVLLDDVDVSELTSLRVAPLVTTTYTLTAKSEQGEAMATLAIEVTDAPGLVGAVGRYVEVVKNDPNNTQLHLSEIEVFAFGITPNGSLASGLSTNGLLLNGSHSVQDGPTTDLLEHGVAQSVFNGALEQGEDTWTTQRGLPDQPRFVLDLGAPQAVGRVRLFGRADSCCLNRLQNVTVNVYADSGEGMLGELVSSAKYSGTAPPGHEGHIEVDLSILDPGIREFSAEHSVIGPGAPVTLNWAVTSTSTRIIIDQGVGDVTPISGPDGTGSITLDPGPHANTVYTLTVTHPGSTSVSSFLVEVTNQPQIRSFTADASPVIPGAGVQLSWEVSNATSLSLNGQNVTGLNGITINPESTTGYRLTATNAYGSTREELRVQVVLPGEPVISEFMADNETGLKDENGEASDWIELCNPTAEPAQLAGYYLTDDRADLTKWQFPALTLDPGGCLVVFATGNDRRNARRNLHTNFSLERTGEYLALVKPDGKTIVTEFAPYPEQRQDVSYGFDREGLQEAFLVPPTPRLQNRTSYTGFVADTTFSVDRGFYDRPFQVEITSATPDVEIRYTIDGTTPTARTGRLYVAPVHIRRTVVLRAAAFKEGLLPTNVDTQTYIFPADVIADPRMRKNVTQHNSYSHLMEASLKAIPTISLVFPGDVDRTEKKTSIEFINFEAGDSQVDAGMERFGSYHTDFAKRSMRLNFRSEYGASKLRFPIFDGHEYSIPPAAKFDSINLRAGNHDMQWGGYLANRFTDDSMLEMGNIAPHGRFVHLYLNGKYNGQYHLRERWNGAMVSEYFPGGKDDYEAVNANDGFSAQMRVYDGSGVQWDRARRLVAGAEPFGRSGGHIDIPNIIDFMLLWLSGSCESEFRSAGAVQLGVPFKFFIKDADGYLRAPHHNVTHPGPLNIMAQLSFENDPDFNMLLADRIHKHFFNDGALTPLKNSDRLQRRYDECRLSFLAESARWGFQSPVAWERFQENVLEGLFPTLRDTMVQRFKFANMYPSLPAPSFSQHGGFVPAGFQLRMGGRVPGGKTYYTIDGSDPRLSGTPTQRVPTLTLVAETVKKKIHMPTHATDRFVGSNGKNWNEVGYDDSAWIPARGAIGYEAATGFEDFIKTDIQAPMYNRHHSCLIRIPFSPTEESLEGANRLEFRIRYDDGFVAYLNGIEIARKNFIGDPDGNSRASTSHSDAAAILLETIDVSEHLELIVAGQENMLAIHGLNLSKSSPDFLISADLRVLKELPPGQGGGVSPTAILYDRGIPITERILLRARTVRDDEWSALNEAVFIPEQDYRALVVSEIMYNPSAATAGEIAAGYADSEDFEYLELLNTSERPLDLRGVSFGDGIEFEFGDLVLPPGGRVVIVEDLAAFEYRYGRGALIAGQYGGKLRDEGESIELHDPHGNVIQLFEYDNRAPWPVSASGLGSSLVLVDPGSRPDHNRAISWRASGFPGGTPGGPEQQPQTYETWAAVNGAGAAEEDDDLDGLSNYLEYVLLERPDEPSVRRPLAPSIIELDLGGGPEQFLSLEVRHRLTSTEFAVSVEVSGDLVTWDGSGNKVALYNRSYHGDGSVTSIFRSTVPIAEAEASFLRVRFVGR